MKTGKFSDYEDEVIKTFVETNSTNIQEAIAKAARVLKRTHISVESRYYRMRGNYRVLFTMIDNRKSGSPINTKNWDRAGKFRRDLVTTKKTIVLKRRIIKKTDK